MCFIDKRVSENLQKCAIIVAILLVQSLYCKSNLNHSALASKVKIHSFLKSLIYVLLDFFFTFIFSKTYLSLNFSHCAWAN